MDYYYKGDPLGWAAKAVENFAAFRKTIEDARENPAYVDTRIDDNMQAFRRRSLLALKLGMTEETLAYAEATIEGLRNARGFFEYLAERVAMLNADDDVAEHVLAVLDAEPERALELLAQKTPVNMGHVASLVRRYEHHAAKAQVKPMRLKLIVHKLNGLMVRMGTA